MEQIVIAGLSIGQVIALFGAAFAVFLAGFGSARGVGIAVKRQPALYRRIPTYSARRWFLSCCRAPRASMAS